MPPARHPHAPRQPRRTRRPDAHTLADFIRARRERVIDLWASCVRAIPIAQELDRPALLDHVPELLDRIAELIERIDAGEQPSPMLSRTDAEHHAVARLEEGFDLAQVVRELSILRDCIVKLWCDAASGDEHLRELRVLDQAIDRAIQASIARYTQARDRALRAVDTVAIAALESRDLDELLARFLRVLVETTPAIDGAAILLRDGHVLRVRASVGAGEQPGATIAIGEGFAGTIAAKREPIALGSPRDPLVVSPALRAADLRALYGVPLVERGQLLGVAYMGSRTAPELSSQDKRLFVAMANRVTSTIAHHVLQEEAAQTTAALRERDQQFRALADNIPQLAWMTDPSGYIHWYNRRWLDYTGSTLEQSLGWGWRAFHHPDHVARVVEHFRAAFEHGEAWEDTFPLRGRDGNYRWFLSRAIPIRDEDGRITRWFGTNTDITEQRFLATAAALLASSLDYHATLERLAALAVPDVADWCAVDLLEDAAIRRVASAHVNPAKLALGRELGGPPRLDAPFGVGRVIRERSPAYVPDLRDELRAASIHDPEQLRLVRELGLVSYVCVPLLVEGVAVGAITLAMAESGRRYEPSQVELATALARSAGTALHTARLYREAQVAVREREDLLAIVSHDLRNPLGSIALAASMLLQTAEDPRARRQLEIIGHAAKRMERLIADLLDLASIQTGRLALERKPEDVCALVHELLELHAPLAAEKRVVLVPACELDGVAISCDRERLAQVFGNLIGNALKFCAADDTIIVRGRRRGPDAVFEVEDTGPGIAPADLPHLFEPYWSAKRHAKQGTGLGLFISKGIVEAHGGTIAVENVPGRGARFTITLPLGA